MIAHDLNGIDVHTTLACPEFVQTVRLRPCGCSPEMLSSMNAWLLERFGQHRQVMSINGQYLVMHPNTLVALRQASRMK